MNSKSVQIRLLASIIILLLVSACSLPFISGEKSAGEAKPTDEQQTDAGNIANQQETDENEQVEGILPDPQVGLTELPAYLAGFRQDMVGTLKGEPYERHTYLLLSRDTSSDDYDFMNLSSGTGLIDYQSRVLSLDHTFYRWTQPDPSCQGSDQAPAEGEVLEPASLLLPVMQADKLGSETVNEIDSTHYQFTEDDLNGVENGTVVAGDVWIANQDGYVVKYSLVVTPPTNSATDDLSVTQTWSYDLSIPEAGSGIILPPNCQAVPLDLPLPTDTQDVRRTGGNVSFVTGSTARQVVDYYAAALPDTGWAAPDTLPDGEIELPYMATFTQAEQTLDLVLDEAESNGIRVDIFIRTPQMSILSEGTQPTATTVPSGSGVPTPVATIDPSASGLPDDIPLYPGATDLFSMDTVTMFSSTDDIGVIQEYYKQAMPDNGWSLSLEQNAEGTQLQQWSKNGVEIFITMTADSGRVTVVITRITE